MVINIRRCLSITIIDIRSKYKYDLGHIKDSINIDEYNLLFNYNKYLNKNEKYIIYCDNGNRSKIVVNKLKRLGYNVENLDGGYNNYLLQK